MMFLLMTSLLNLQAYAFQLPSSGRIPSSTSLHIHRAPGFASFSGRNYGPQAPADHWYEDERRGRTATVSRREDYYEPEFDRRPRDDADYSSPWSRNDDNYDRNYRNPDYDRKDRRNAASYSRAPDYESFHGDYERFDNNRNPDPAYDDYDEERRIPGFPRADSRRPNSRSDFDDDEERSKRRSFLLNKYTRQSRRYRDDHEANYDRSYDREDDYPEAEYYGREDDLLEDYEEPRDFRYQDERERGPAERIRFQQEQIMEKRQALQRASERRRRYEARQAIERAAHDLKKKKTPPPPPPRVGGRPKSVRRPNIPQPGPQFNKQFFEKPNQSPKQPESFVPPEGYEIYNGQNLVEEPQHAPKQQKPKRVSDSTELEAPPLAQSRYPKPSQAKQFARYRPGMDLNVKPPVKPKKAPSPQHHHQQQESSSAAPQVVERYVGREEEASRYERAPPPPKKKPQPKEAPKVAQMYQRYTKPSSGSGQQQPSIQDTYQSLRKQEKLEHQQRDDFMHNCGKSSTYFTPGRYGGA